MREGDKAIDWCTRSIQLDENLLDAYLNRAEAYILKDLLDEAIRDFSKVQEKDQSNRQGRFVFGLLRFYSDGRS
jgi:tetratricopeptide (TPR) repeat protein